MFDKFYVINNECIFIKNDIEDFLDLKSETFENLKLVYLFNEEDLLEPNIEIKINDILNKLTKNIDKNDIIISFDHQVKENLDNNKTLKKLKELKNKFLDVNIGMEQEFETFDVEKVENANKILDTIANEIKSKNLTELESLLYAYMIVSNRLIIDNKKNISLSRSIYGVLNTKYIVCVGYSEFLREIVKRLNLKNVKIFLNNVIIRGNGKINSLHRNLIIYVKDEKYNIDGYFYFDPTWDASKLNHLNFFMLQLREIKNINKFDITEDKVKFDGITKDNYRREYFRPFNRPVLNNCVSFFNNSAKLCKEFEDFIKSDKNYSEVLKDFTMKDDKNLENNNYLILDDDEIVKDSKANYKYIFNLIDSKNKDLDFENFCKLLRNVIYKKEDKLNKLQKDELIENIIEENIKFNKICFNDNSKTIFKNLKLEDKTNNTLNF